MKTEKIEFKKATACDLDAIADIYSRIHDVEERGEQTIGWQRGVYPERETAEAALLRDDLFVELKDGKVVGAAILNKLQVDIYADVRWHYKAPPDQVMVMHTLVIDPLEKGNGLGRAFESFYESYAMEQGCCYLRIDTNERNIAARKLYKSLGYREADILPCVFNGMEGIRLVMLEKYIKLTN